MTTSPGDASVPTPEAPEAEEKEFDIDAALNTKGFAEFMAEFPDGDSAVNDPEEVEKRFETFERKGQLAKDLKELFREKIHQETGLKLSDKELDDVEKLLGKEAVNDPERVTEFADLSEEFRENGEAVIKLEEEIKKYGGDAQTDARLKELKQDYDKLLDVGIRESSHYFTVAGAMAEKVFSIFGYKGKENQEALERRANMSQKYGISKDWDRTLSGKEYDGALKKVEEEIKYIEDVTKARGQAAKDFTRLKKELTEGLLPVAEVIAVARTKVKERLVAMSTDINKAFTFQKAEEAEGFISKVQESSESGQDYLEGFDVKKFIENMNKTIETKAAEQVIEAVAKVPVSSGSLTALERSIEKFKSREKIGSREGGEVAVFLEETLKTAAKDPKMVPAKKILISRLIAKLNA